jgi:hypothetical protein
MANELLLAFLYFGAVYKNSCAVVRKNTGNNHGIGYIENTEDSYFSHILLS